MPILQLEVGLGRVTLGLGLGASESVIADCRQGIRGNRPPVAG